jgi:hypothetical protein
VQQRDLLHPFLPKDRSDLHQRLHVVFRLKQREFSSEEEQKDRPCGPDIDG